MRKRPWMGRAAFLFFLLFSSSASAGFVEIGVSGSYRRSNLDPENFEETKSITGSFSYYFMELSALELSYTKGLTEVNTVSQILGGQTTQVEFQLIGLDFVLSGGERESTFRPYVKVGAVHIDRKIVITNDVLATPEVIKPEDGIAPSAGIGAKIVIQKQMAIKFGVEAWTSPLGQDPVEYNYTGRVGISWIF